MGLLEAMLIALITGVVSSAGTIAALKTDINWIKKGYTLRGGRVVKATATRKRWKTKRRP